MTNTVSGDFPGNYANEEHAWDKEAFRQGFQVQFHANQACDAQFSLVGVDASIANAFRRILIAEIPTLAIETVFVNNNTSVIQDEVLAHRLGLIPFAGSKPGIRDFLTFWKKPREGEDAFATTFDNNNDPLPRPTSRNRALDLIIHPFLLLQSTPRPLLLSLLPLPHDLPRTPSTVRPLQLRPSLHTHTLSLTPLP